MPAAFGPNSRVRGESRTSRSDRDLYPLMRIRSSMFRFPCNGRNGTIPDRVAPVRPRGPGQDGRPAVPCPGGCARPRPRAPAMPPRAGHCRGRSRGPPGGVASCPASNPGAMPPPENGASCVRGHPGNAGVPPATRPSRSVRPSGRVRGQDVTRTLQACTSSARRLRPAGEHSRIKGACGPVRRLAGDNGNRSRYVCRELRFDASRRGTCTASSYWPPLS